MIYCIPIQICKEFSDLIGREAVHTGAYRLVYGTANGQSGTRHQIYYFRHMIVRISKRSSVEFSVKVARFQMERET